MEMALFALAAVLFLVGHAVDRPESTGLVLGPRRDEILRVVTWNVGEASGAVGAGLRDRYLGPIAETLQELDPDLCFLQEVRDPDQLERLRRRLGEGWQAAVAGRGDRRVSVLARRGTLRRIRLPPTCRPALGVRYESPGRPGVAAIAVHADAFSASRRNRQIGSAADALNELVGHRGVDVGLLVGDLNLDLDLDKRRDLFTDDQHRDVETYNYVTARLRDVGLGSGATAEPDRRLDYVFLTPGSVAVSDAGPWKGRRVGLMDHDPVVADLAVSGYRP